MKYVAESLLVPLIAIVFYFSLSVIFTVIILAGFLILPVVSIAMIQVILMDYLKEEGYVQ